MAETMTGINGLRVAGLVDLRLEPAKKGGRVRPCQCGCRQP